jgi:hypothetical protein
MVVFISEWFIRTARRRRIAKQFFDIRWGSSAFLEFRRTG